MIDRLYSVEPNNELILPDETIDVACKSISPKNFTNGDKLLSADLIEFSEFILDIEVRLLHTTLIT